MTHHPEVEKASNEIWNGRGKLTHNDIDNILTSLISRIEEGEREKAISTLEAVTWPSDGGYIRGWKKAIEYLRMANPPTHE